MHTAQLTLKYLQASVHVGSGEPPISTQPLRILDLCTGTGCISLLLHALLAGHLHRLFILGIDLSTTAIGLAKENLEHNLRLGLLSNRSRTEIHFHQGDVLAYDTGDIPKLGRILESYEGGSGSKQAFEWDVLISNPPYVSPTSLQDGTTARSVRTYEPELALVPPAHMNHHAISCKREDIFYYRLITLSFKLSIKVSVLECGSRQQGGRVATMFKDLAKLRQDHEWAIDIWPDIETGLRDNCLDEGNGPCAVILRRLPTYTPDQQSCV